MTTTVGDEEPGTPPTSNQFQVTLDVPNSSEKDIPRIIGKGGFNIRNLVKFSAKKWYDKHEALRNDLPGFTPEDGEKVRAPHVRVNVLHNEGCAYFQLTSSCELMVNCAKEATEDLVEKLSKPREQRPKGVMQDTDKPQKRTHRPINEKVMKQFFRVEMDPMSLGKLIGKGGTRVQQMIEYVVATDHDKAGARDTKIFVKEQTAPLANERCIDLEEYGDGSEKFVLFIATVSTRNLYGTMRNVEKAIEKNINRSSLVPTSRGDENARDTATAEKMFEEANDEYDGGW